MKKLLVLLALVTGAWASGGESLIYTWVGVASLVIFIVGYYIIATEEKYSINKAKPALFIGTFIFMLIGAYYSMHNMDTKPLEHAVESLI